MSEAATVEECSRASPSWRVRAPRATSKPAWARWTAMALPIPRLAPVTRATPRRAGSSGRPGPPWPCGTRWSWSSPFVGRTGRRALDPGHCRSSVPTAPGDPRSSPCPPPPPTASTSPTPPTVTRRRRRCWPSTASARQLTDFPAAFVDALVGRRLPRHHLRQPGPGRVDLVRRRRGARPRRPARRPGGPGALPDRRHGRRRRRPARRPRDRLGPRPRASRWAG